MQIENLLLNTAYYAPIAYFSAIAHAKTIFIEQFENFVKQSYRNRCEIMTANGVIPLTVPVHKANSKTLLKDLKIVYVTPWQKMHLRGIISAYKNSPYFEYYIDDLIPFFEKKETWLLDLNQAILEKLLGFLKLDSTVRLTEDYIREGNPLYTDFRNAIHPKTARRHTEIEFVRFGRAHV